MQGHHGGVIGPEKHLIWENFDFLCPLRIVDAERSDRGQSGIVKDPLDPAQGVPVRGNEDTELFDARPLMVEADPGPKAESFS